MRGARYTFPDNWVGRVQLRDGDRANLSGLRLRAETAKRVGRDERFVFRTGEDVIKMNLSADEMINITDKAFEKYSALMAVCWSLEAQAEFALNYEQLPVVPANMDDYDI